MSELLKKRATESVGKTIKIYLENGWRYEGEVIGSDEKFIEILDFKSNSYKVIKFIDVKDLEVSL